MIDQIIAFNKTFVEQKGYEKYLTSKYPDKKLAVLSCMDTRLTELLPAALGLKNGDAKIIKNAGGLVISAFDSAMLNSVSGKQCKVLLINGSPRTDGNTFCCLQEIEATLQKHGIETEIIQIGRKPVRMCINCGGCHQPDAKSRDATKVKFIK